MRTESSASELDQTNPGCLFQNSWCKVAIKSNHTRILLSQQLLLLLSITCSCKTAPAALSRTGVGSGFHRMHVKRGAFLVVLPEHPASPRGQSLDLHVGRNFEACFDIGEKGGLLKVPIMDRGG